MDQFSARTRIARDIRSAMSRVANATEVAHELEAFDLVAKCHEVHTNLFELHTQCLQPLLRPTSATQRAEEDLPF